MKLSIIVLLIFICNVALGQSSENEFEIDTIKTIRLSQIPDNEITLIDDNLVFKFSRKLILQYIDQWINIEKAQIDSTDYLPKDLTEIRGHLEKVRSKYSDKSSNQLILPITIFEKNKKNLEQAEISNIVKTDMLFRKEIICKMIDNGEFECTINSSSFNSILYVKITETDDNGTAQIRKSYLIGNKYEFMLCCFEKLTFIAE